MIFLIVVIWQNQYYFVIIMIYYKTKLVCCCSLFYQAYYSQQEAAAGEDGRLAAACKKNKKPFIWLSVVVWQNGWALSQDETWGIRLPLLHAQQWRVQTEVSELKPSSRESRFKAGLAATASSNKDCLGNSPKWLSNLLRTVQSTVPLC